MFQNVMYVFCRISLATSSLPPLSFLPRLFLPASYIIFPFPLHHPPSVSPSIPLCPPSYLPLSLPPPFFPFPTCFPVFSSPCTPTLSPLPMPSVSVFNIYPSFSSPPCLPIASPFCSHSLLPPVLPLLHIVPFSLLSHSRLPPSFIPLPSLSLSLCSPTPVCLSSSLALP